MYALVADFTRTPDFSAEVVRCAWLDGASGPVVGARFEAVNKVRRGSWKNRPGVTVADPGREFSFSRTEKMAGEITWRYRFAAEDGGTRVTESYEVVRPVSRAGWFVITWLFGNTDRRGDLRCGMQQTLPRLKATAESEQLARLEGKTRSDRPDRLETAE